MALIVASDMGEPTLFYLLSARAGISREDANLQGLQTTASRPIENLRLRRRGATPVWLSPGRLFGGRRVVSRSLRIDQKAKVIAVAARISNLRTDLQ